jgi:hypothetical protein
MGGEEKYGAGEGGGERKQGTGTQCGATHQCVPVCVAEHAVARQQGELPLSKSIGVRLSGRQVMGCPGGRGGGVCRRCQHGGQLPEGAGVRPGARCTPKGAGIPRWHM